LESFVPPIVDVQCPNCSRPSEIEYRRLGSGILCSGCQTSTVPFVATGGSYPNTQWELNFHDFLMLVRDRDSREQVEPLLHAWFRYRLRGAGLETQILDSGSQSLDLLAVHLAIQDDSAKQLSLYQAAMSLWR
jgi:hypothetical protein